MLCFWIIWRFFWTACRVFRSFFGRFYETFKLESYSFCLKLIWSCFFTKLKKKCTFKKSYPLHVLLFFCDGGSSFYKDKLLGMTQLFLIGTNKVWTGPFFMASKKTLCCHHQQLLRILFLILKERVCWCTTGSEHEWHFVCSLLRRKIAHAAVSDNFAKNPCTTIENAFVK